MTWDRTCVARRALRDRLAFHSRGLRLTDRTDKGTPLGFEEELLVSKVPAVTDLPLSALAHDENLDPAFGDDTEVPVAQFQSSV